MQPPTYYEGRRDQSGVRVTLDDDYGFAEVDGLCAACSTEAAFTSLVSRTPTSMLPLEMIQAAGLCPRCGGSKERAAQLIRAKSGQCTTESCVKLLWHRDKV
jgi:hypothetical protein